MILYICLVVKRILTEVLCHNVKYKKSSNLLTHPPEFGSFGPEVTSLYLNIFNISLSWQESDFKTRRKETLLRFSSSYRKRFKDQEVNGLTGSL